MEQGNRNIVVDIWSSFRAMPGWVQVWVALWLVPVNMVSFLFIAQPSGVWIAVLAIGAMMLNLPVMLFDRGFSKAMALPHIPIWTVLVIWLIAARPEGDEAYGTFLLVLLVTDLVSLIFDYPDGLKWLRGDRKPAGR